MYSFTTLGAIAGLVIAIILIIRKVHPAYSLILGALVGGIIGGGGLGKIALNYGYYRYKYLVMIFAVILLILLVQLFQTCGTKLAVRSDKRLKNKSE